jgi:hypothetical protein
MRGEAGRTAGAGAGAGGGTGTGTETWVGTVGGHPDTAAATAAFSANLEPKWELRGVFPVNPTVDEPLPRTRELLLAAVQQKAAAFPAVAPLRASVTGAFAVCGFNGERLQHCYPDLSHMSIGLRHMRRVLIQLPTLYTDLYHMVRAQVVSETHILLFFLLF